MASGLLQSSILAGRTAVQARSAFSGKRVTARTNGTRVYAKVANWLPGSDTPAYLEDLPGSYGFDPLGLGQVPSNLDRFREAELIHCRWAMAGAAGILAVELFGFGDWYSAPLWAVNGGTPTWFGVPVPFSLPVIVGFEVIALAGAESFRNLEPDGEKRKYPGGAFDPLGFSKDQKAFETNKLKEIKNGRLAMVAVLGFFAQHAATGKSPLQALGAHLSDPWKINFATNGVSVPFGFQ